MIEMRVGLPEEEALQKELWKLAFGDDDSYIDDFYARKAAAGVTMLVLLDESQLRSMVALFPVTIQLADGTQVSSSYIYALATHPSHQDKGYARLLLAYVDSYLKGKGIQSVTIVPASPSLHRFFATTNFQECFGTRKLELLSYMAKDVSETDAMAPTTPAHYNQLREKLLEGTFHVSYSDQVIAHQQGISQMSSCDLYHLSVSGTEGCMAAEYLNDDTLLVKELLVPPAVQTQATSLLMKTLPALRYHIRTPLLWEGISGAYTQAFGMVKWYQSDLEKAWHTQRKAYMGLGFD